MHTSTARRSDARWFGYAPREVSALVHRHVVAEHASEAGWLWVQRERATRAPHYRLADLAKLDARVLAHLRGLQVAGPAGLEAARGALERVDPGAVFVLAWLAFGAADTAAMRHSLQLAAIDPLCEAAVAAGIAWCDAPAVQAPLDRLAASTDARHRRLALAGCIAHRLPCDTRVDAALTDPDPGLRALGAEAIGRLGMADHLPLLERAVDDPDDGVRIAAALANPTRHAPRLFDALMRLPDPPREAIETTVRAGDAAWGREAVRRLAADPQHRRLALCAAGAAGDPAVLPWLLAACREPAHARVAAEAIATLTGADLRYLDLHADSPDDADDTLDEDTHLPWPAADALAAWCAARSDRWRPGVRYLGGRPIDAGGCVAVLREGGQRQRAAAAVERACLAPGEPLFPVRERADRQRRWLGA